MSNKLDNNRRVKYVKNPIELRIAKLAISVSTAKKLSGFRISQAKFSRISETYSGRNNSPILGGRKLLVCVRTVVTAVFDVVMEEDEKRVKIVTLRVGARVKEGKGEGGGKPNPNPFLFSLPFPYPAPFETPHFLFSFRVSTWRFREQNIRATAGNACSAC